MPRMTGGQALVEALQIEGVTTVFGIPGHQNLDIYDALARQQQIRHVLARHEEGVAYMADGYARATGQPGVAITTTGPGGCNAMAALGEAYADSSPVLHVMSEIDLGFIGQNRGIDHEMKDQLDCFRSVTSWNALVERPAQIPELVREAFRRMRVGRPRPVQLQIPCDVQAMEEEVTLLPPTTYTPPSGDERLVGRAVEVLNASERPLIYAGGGANRSGASEELAILADLLQAPVLTTTNGKGAVPDDHLLGLGDAWARDAPAHRLVQAADAVLAVGTRFQATMTARWTMQMPERLVQIDIDSSELGKNYPVAVGIPGDARTVLRQLAERLTPHAGRRAPRTEEVARVKAAQREYALNKARAAVGVLDTVRSALPRDAIVTTNSLIGFWANRFFPTYAPNTFFAPVGFSNMGFALPVAIGARVGCPDRKVLGLSGDGSFLFSLQELHTAVCEGVPIVMLVCTDGAYGSIKFHQRRRFEGRYMAADFPAPDFVKLPESFGARGVRLHGTDGLAGALGEGLAADHPTVIELWGIPLAESSPFRHIE